MIKVQKVRKNVVPDENEWSHIKDFRLCSICKLSDKSLLGETRLVKDTCGKKFGDDAHGPIRLLK